METKFTQKVLLIVVALLGWVFLFLWLRASLELLLLVFAGILIAVYFRRMAELIAQRTKLKWWQSLTLVIVGTLAAITAFVRGFGAKINQQTSDLQGKLPELSQSISDKLSQSSAGKRILQQGKELQSQWQQNNQEIFGAITSFFSSTFGALGNLYIILILSIYFTATPSLYKKTLIKLFPASKRERATALLQSLYETLGKWILGQLLAMIIVAIATGIGLRIMGVPYFLLFAIIAGALNFIPNFWPLIAMVPAALVALTVSPALALGVVILYVVIQNIEGEFVTPLIQQKMVNLPPAYIILFQVFMAIIAWWIWVILATPLLSIIIVLIQKLYVEPVADQL